MACPLDWLLQNSVDINMLDQKTAMALIIYHRWVIRTLSQRFLPNVDKSTNIGVTAENLANENILRKLQEQLPTSIHILEQALSVTEDMTLPTGPSLESRRKENIEHEDTPADAETSTDNILQNVASSSCDENKVENEAAINNGSSEGSNGGDIKQITNTCTEEEVVNKVKKDDIVAQVSFDLGTLYFYQEKFQQAVKMFESCKNAQVCFY
ncbi:PREDICTED: uncharacterized protein LOC107345648 [Acropora digitifera]|uniref:uncharacterized protein LOC107345648 n=1 Tax=Acropora digitifera TaxID=70779 RepID=UPI00077A5754|nr:PREDICTED: uncharacterized protein LOC107345648 [Acropora digitifera]